MVKAASALVEPPALSLEERAQSIAASKELQEVRAQRDAGWSNRTLPHRKLSEARWAAFIAAVREVGPDVGHAAALADGDRAWTLADAYRQAIRSDPLREREYRGAVKFWESRIQRKLFELGIEGVETPVFQGGELVGTKRVFSEKIALAMASHFLKLVERRQDSTVHVQNASDDGGALLTLTVGEAMAMPLEMRRAMTPILEWLRSYRAAGDASSVPAIEHVEDVEVEIVEEEELPPLSPEDAAALEAIR